jgi:hypothetical protein
MPILAYFAVTGPLLLAALLALSAYLEPDKAPTPGELLGIQRAHASHSSAAIPADKPSDFERLRARPLG